MLLSGDRRLESVGGIIGGVFLVLTFGHGPQYGIMSFGALFLISAVIFLLRFHDLQRVINDQASLLMGWLYLPLLLGFLVQLHAMPDGRRWVLLVLIMAMACDSAAYFVGTAMGKHRLYPAISPNKSIEGAVGGFVGSVTGAVLIGNWLIPAVSWFDFAVCGALVGVLGQLGDLFESMLKRHAGIKDSGAIFPGHGGMLDRLDSLLFAFPVVYFYLVVCSGS